MSQFSSSLLRSEHYPLRGLYLARRNAIAGRMPRIQLIPAKPVLLPDGTSSTLLTEFGWISDDRHSAFEDDIAQRLKYLAGEEFMTNAFCEGLPLRLDPDSVFLDQRRRPGEGLVPLPPELQTGLKARLHTILRKRFALTPWSMKPRTRIEAVNAMTRFERTLQAIWHHCPHQEGETVEITFKPEDLGPQSWKAWWFGSSDPVFTPHPMIQKPKHNTAWKEAMALVSTAFLGTKGSVAKVRLIGGEPSAHQTIEDATILEPFQLTPEMIAAGELPFRM